MTKRQSIGGLVIASTMLLIGVVWFSFHQTQKVATPVVTDTSQIHITTGDGITLAATIKYPVRNVLSPVVILLHDYGQDRHQWDPYLQKFLDAGIAVLSYDMRGFGDSRLPTIPTNQDDHLNSLTNDLPAVMEYIQQQPAIDQNRIMIVGASIGADVAFVVSGSGLGITRTVLLSPVVRSTTLDGHLVENFGPKNIFGIASDSEKTDLESFMSRVADPKQTSIIPNDGHGIALLSSSSVMESIIAWLKS